tara:strand:+ start:145 stop:354 length:210 start_codon:yes stop_codon:yes gene_type:complete
MDKKNRIKIKKNVKYSICSCGYSKKIPYCDNQHRIYNQKNNMNYKSVKIYATEDTEIELTCSNWIKEDE